MILSNFVVKVKLLKESSGIGIVNNPVGFFLVSKLGSPLGAMMYYNPGTHVGLQLIVYIPPGLNVR